MIVMLMIQMIIVTYNDDDDECELSGQVAVWTAL